MASTRGLEQDFGQLYINEPGSGQRPVVYSTAPSTQSPQRHGPTPFRNGTVSEHPPDRPPYPDALLYPDYYGYTDRSAPYSYQADSGHMGHYGPPRHNTKQKWDNPPYRQQALPPTGQGQGQRKPTHGRGHEKRQYGGRRDYASTTPSGGGTPRPPNVLLSLRLKAGGGAVISLPEDMGLPTFKPVVYANPDAGSESDEDEELPPPQPQHLPTQHISQSAGYYANTGPQQYPQQGRLTHIPVQHVSTSQQMQPSTSQSGVVYSGVASAVPMSRSQNTQQYRAVQESDYVNAPVAARAVTSQTSDFYTEEDDFIPPAVPSKVSYGSVSASSYTPEIKGPQYRIAPDVYASQHGGGGGPMSPLSSSSRTFSGHYPEPVSSKLMYTSPVAPAGQGYSESHHKDATPNTTSISTSSGPPPPMYDTQPKYPASRDNSPMSYPANYSSSQTQPPVAKTGLYNYSTEHALLPGGGDKKEAEVDALTQMLMQNMEAAADPDFFGPCTNCGRHVRGIYNACVALDSVYHIGCFRCRLCGMCARCGRSIMGDNAGCTALDQLYHVDCFSCIACGHGLGGQPFFAMEGKPYCETCYMSTLEKCSVCSKAITDRILRATGKPYHPACFMCVVCGKSLDGVPFTVDATNQIHCIEDFHKKFAPRCCVCGEPILPDSGQEETVRIVAMDKSFHVGCYRCEDCGLVLSSEAEGRGCYPLDDHILCKNCNARRIQMLTGKMTTEL